MKRQGNKNYDLVDLWISSANSIDFKKYNYDNVLICLVSQLKEIYNKSINFGISPNEFNNGSNIYILMLERTRFLDKNED